MNPRTERDVRLVLAPWLLAFVLVAVSAFMPRSFGQGWIVTVLIFAWLIISASVFGGEFAHGTMPHLLAQPIDRRRVWKEKMIVLAIALTTLFVAVVAVQGSHIEKSATLWLAIVPAMAFCTIPFYTLVGRSTIAAVILAVPVPGLIFVVGAGVVLWMFHVGALESNDKDSPINEERLHLWVRAYFGIVLPAYCGLLYYLGYRRFLNFEVAGRNQRQIRLPASMLLGVERIVSCLVPSRLRHLRALVAKELHLQHNATTLFVVFAILQVLAIAYIKFAHPSDPQPFFTVPLFIYAAIMPLVIGSSAIAEETSLGTHGWHLTLPCSAGRQWVTKFAVVLVLTGVFAVGVPVLWVAMACAVTLPGVEWPAGFLFVFFGFDALTLAVVAFYASSFSRDTLRALLITLGLCSGTVCLVALIVGVIARIEPVLLSLLRQFSASGINDAFNRGWPLLIAPSVLVVLAASQSFRLFRSADRQRVWPITLLVFLPPIFLFAFLISLHDAADKLR